jgi:hypothetical protein
MSNSIVIAGLFNWLMASHMILGLYALPALFSAYVYGRRHAVLMASASIFIVLSAFVAAFEHGQVEIPEALAL